MSMWGGKPKISTVYYKEWSWKRSPEVWQEVGKWLVISFALGAMFMVWAGCSDVTKDLQSPVPCKTTQPTPARGEH